MRHGDDQQALEEFMEYRDKSWGFLSDRPRNNTGNGLMYTAYYCVFLHELQQQDQQNIIVQTEIERVKKLYRSCYVPGGGMLRVPPPSKWGHPQAPDDYFGVALYCRLFDQDLGKKLMGDLRSTWGFLHPEDPGVFRIKSFMGRMPQLVIQMAFGAGEKPNMLFAVPAYLLAMFWALTKHRRSADSFRKAWFMYYTAKGVNPILDLFLEVWHVLFKRKWKGGIGEADYFRAEHPITWWFHAR